MPSEPRRAARQPRFAWLPFTVFTLGLIFFLFPDIDLWVAGLFHEPGEGFWLQRDPIVRFLRSAAKIPVYVLGGALLASLAWRAIAGRYLPGLDKRVIVFVVLAGLLGPALMANAIFKDNWGRARPYQLEQFGGELTFTRPLIVSDQCERNCSFVSGEGTYGFYFVALALAIPYRRRALFWTALSGGLVMGLGLGAIRIVQGGHFLSDVYYGDVFMILIGLYLRDWIFARGGLDPAFQLLNREVMHPLGRG